MRLTSTYLLAICLSATLNTINSAAFAEDVVLFEDSFSDLKGHVVSQKDGKVKFSGGTPTRRIYPFMGVAKDAIGELVIESLEDSETLGPDKMPGVLAIAYRLIPDRAAYSGITYHGGRADDKTIVLKEVTDTPTPERLRQIRLTFKYRAANAVDPEAVGASYNFRLEPNSNDTYSKRIGFGAIHATSKWKTFAATLDQGENNEAFLKSVVAEHPKGYRLVWGQTGLINTYQAGDTLLIDDVQITLLTATKLPGQ